MNEEMECGECGSTEGTPRSEYGCSECYVNDDCPSGCNDEHDEPSPNYDGQWTCPTTGNLYTIDNGEWELQGRWPMLSTWVDPADEWYCYPSDHGWYMCDDCTEWVHEDNAHNYNGDLYCRSCYDYAREMEEPSYDDDYYVETAPGVQSVVCEECRNGAVTHWHPVTERVVCEPCSQTTPGYEPVPVLVAA